MELVINHFVNFSLHETSARRDDSCPVKAKLAQVSTDLNTFLIGEYPLDCLLECPLDCPLNYPP